jgi:UDP-2,3-diacylglucosamine pyrophosphatase LpxH
MATCHGRCHRSVQTLFISDVHLGYRHSQPEALLHYLHRHQPQRIYLVGDFIDGWKLCRSWYWMPIYNQVLHRLSELASTGTKLFYTPGNHDAFLRDQTPLHKLAGQVGLVEIADEIIFQTQDGRRFLVTHGERFDVFETHAQWLSSVASLAYDSVLSIDYLLSRLCKSRGRSPYWRFAALKYRIKRATSFLEAYENRVTQYAKSRRCDGVICGHIHTPTITERDGVSYCNTGDWVEHCTALAEYDDGQLALEHYYPRGVDQNRPPLTRSDLPPVTTEKVA